MLFLVDKETGGKYNFAFLILNVSPVRVFIAGLSSSVAFIFKTQFLGYVKVKDNSQLINDISNVLQKLLGCFYGTENSTFFVPQLSAVFHVILILYLKDSEFVIGLVEISL